MSMRGTTPTHFFRTDISLVGVAALSLVYAQNDIILVKKTLDDVTITDTLLSVRLSQSDTLAFKDKTPVSMQIRARFPDGTAVGCDIIFDDVKKILEDGEI